MKTTAKKPKKVPPTKAIPGQGAAASARAGKSGPRKTTRSNTASTRHGVSSKAGPAAKAVPGKGQREDKSRRGRADGKSGQRGQREGDESAAKAKGVGSKATGNGKTMKGTANAASAASKGGSTQAARKSTAAKVARRSSAASTPDSTSKTPAGKPSQGKAPAGKAPAGKAPAGKPSQGKAPAGKAPAGKPSQGKAPAGKAPAGKPSQGKAPAGKAPAGKPSQGKAPAGKPSQGKAPAGKAPAGKALAGKAPAGKALASKAPAGKALASKAPAGKPSPSKPSTEKPSAKPPTMVETRKRPSTKKSSGASSPSSAPSWPSGRDKATTRGSVAPTSDAAPPSSGKLPAARKRPPTRRPPRRTERSPASPRQSTLTISGARGETSVELAPRSSASVAPSIPIPVKEVPRRLTLEQRAAAIDRRIAKQSQEFRERHDESFEMSWIYHDTALEGIVYTYDELTTAFRSEEVTVVDSSVMPIYDAIRRHKAAIDFVRDVGARRRVTLSIDLLKKLYVILHPEEGDAKTVKYRRDIPQHRLYFHEYAPPDRIAHRVRQVIDWLNQPDNRKAIGTLRLAAKAHYDLARAYPFQTDSGKVTRLFMNIVLIRGGLPPAIIHATERQRYYEALKSGSAANLVKMLQDSVENSIASIEKRLDEHETRTRGFVS